MKAKFLICFKLAILVTNLFFAACQPTVILKKGETLKLLGTEPGIQRDTFSYNVPSGKVNILFVVDNGDTANLVPQLFSNLYHTLISRLGESSMRLLDIRMQVTTTPWQNSPTKYFANRGEDHLQNSECHLKELFGDNNNCSQYFPTTIFNGNSEYGDFQPLDSFYSGYKGPAFDKRGNDFFLTVFVLTRDQVNLKSYPEKQTISHNIKLNRGEFHYNSITITKILGSEPCPAFANKIITPATQASIDITSMFYKNFDFNLCKSIVASPQLSFEEKEAVDFIVNHIKQVKTRLVLSKKVFEEPAMIVRSQQTRFLYGRDFSIDSNENEIIWKSPHNLQEGDLLEAVYWTSPAEGDLSQLPDITKPIPVPSGF